MSSDFNSVKKVRVFHFQGGVFWVSSDFNSGKKVRVFLFRGGVFWVSSDLNSGKKVRVFHFQWGVFWVRSDLDSENNFNFGGGGVLWNQILEQGCSTEIWSKISGSLAGCCITDSLSHTTYVETNQVALSKTALAVAQKRWSKIMSYRAATN